MVSDTKPLDATQKCCSKCGESKSLDRIVKNRNVCKDCCNARKKERSKEIVIDIEAIKTCTTCNQSKATSSFIKGRNICTDCNNERRKNKYKSNDEFRANVIKQASKFKHNKVLERRKIKLEEIGEGNKKCSVCSTIKPESKFRHNRLRCKNCEKDDPKEKFKRNIRSRIHKALKQKKEMHTIKYLGCTSPEYLEWIFNYDERYTLDNHGSVWHIDHVIPLSKFDLEDKEEQLIAFNWRNTMPLLAKENLAKNRKILPEQVEKHYKHLLEYHKQKNIEMPQNFVSLFAKHLVDGNPLKQSLPLTSGNLCEDLG